VLCHRLQAFSTSCINSWSGAGLINGYFFTAKYLMRFQSTAIFLLYADATRYNCMLMLPGINYTVFHFKRSLLNLPNTEYTQYLFTSVKWGNILLNCSQFRLPTDSLIENSIATIFYGDKPSNLIGNKKSVRNLQKKTLVDRLWPYLCTTFEFTTTMPSLQ
jgi:hypothetical protein